ncbi:hypothetical protein BpHYR1_003046 [Brachionus plicatilis]|uniref:Uncharacterized protein n=1 Tax=Brachionus plicatilis TaxID=10195 RepID=A0A3M7R0M0_BRAPC|nr:hypothetical protein BpHYR1_003046 [Brachionus plicatilis]
MFKIYDSYEFGAAFLIIFWVDLYFDKFLPDIKKIEVQVGCLLTFKAKNTSLVMMSIMEYYVYTN